MCKINLHKNLKPGHKGWLYLVATASIVVSLYFAETYGVITLTQEMYGLHGCMIALIFVAILRADSTIEYILMSSTLFLYSTLDFLFSSLTNFGFMLGFKFTFATVAFEICALISIGFLRRRLPRIPAVMVLSAGVIVATTLSAVIPAALGEPVRSHRVPDLHVYNADVIVPSDSGSTIFSISKSKYFLALRSAGTGFTVLPFEKAAKGKLLGARATDSRLRCVFGPMPKDREQNVLHFIELTIDGSQTTRTLPSKATPLSSGTRNALSPDGQLLALDDGSLVRFSDGQLVETSILYVERDTSFVRWIEHPLQTVHYDEDNKVLIFQDSATGLLRIHKLATPILNYRFITVSPNGSRVAYPSEIGNALTIENIGTNILGRVSVSLGDSTYYANDIDWLTESDLFIRTQNGILLQLSLDDLKVHQVSQSLEFVWGFAYARETKKLLWTTASTSKKDFYNLHIRRLTPKMRFSI